jgi:hypothetical protein
MSGAPEAPMGAAELCRARDLLGYGDEVLAADLRAQLGARRIA